MGKKGICFPYLAVPAHWLAYIFLTSCWISEQYAGNDLGGNEEAKDSIDVDYVEEVHANIDAAGDAVSDSLVDEISGEDVIVDDIDDEENGIEVVSTTWARSYNLLMPSWGNAIELVPGEGYIVAGYSYYESPPTSIEDVWVLKLNLNGNVLWENRYGRGDRDEQARDVVLTADGGYIVVGRADSFVLDGGAGNFDYLVMRLNADGGLEWFKTYGSEQWDEASAVLRTSDGGYLVAGHTYSCDGILLIKIDDSGDVVWARSYDDVISERVSDVESTLDGGYIMVGETNSYGASPYPSDFLIIKTDVDGNIVWQKIFDGIHSDYPWDVDATSDGGYLIAGFMGSPAGVNGLVINLDGDGGLRWQTWLDTYGTEAIAVQELEEGMSVVGGTGNDSQDSWIMALDENGSILWQKDYRGDDHDVFKSLTVAPDGGFAAVGFTTSFSTSGQSLWMVKTDGTGGLEGLCPPGLGASGSIEAFDHTGSIMDAHTQAADFDVTVTTYDVVTYATSSSVQDACTH